MPSREQILAALVGGAAALALAAALIPARDWLDNTNVALVLVVAVVASAVLGGRLVGVTTALTAALAFNFIHTEPYATFRIARHEDVVTTVLLAVVGLLIGELALRLERSRGRARLCDYGLQRVHRVSELVVSGAPLSEVVDAVCDEVVGELALREIGFIGGEMPPTLPLMGHNGIIEGERSPSGVWSNGELPPEGVELPLVTSGRTVGRLVLYPTPGAAVSFGQRIVAVALADQLALAVRGNRARDTVRR